MRLGPLLQLSVKAMKELGSNALSVTGEHTSDKRIYVIYE